MWILNPDPETMHVIVIPTETKNPKPDACEQVGIWFWSCFHQVVGIYQFDQYEFYWNVSPFLHSVVFVVKSWMWIDKTICLKFSLTRIRHLPPPWIQGTCPRVGFIVSLIQIRFRKITSTTCGAVFGDTVNSMNTLIFQCDNTWSLLCVIFSMFPGFIFMLLVAALLLTIGLICNYKVKQRERALEELQKPEVCGSQPSCNVVSHWLGVYTKWFLLSVAGLFLLSLP